MKEIDQNQIVEQYVKAVKEKRKYSNCQIMIDEIKEKTNAGKLFAFELQDAFLIIESKRDLYYLYYICNSWEWIQLLDVIREQYKEVIISIVRRETTDIKKIFAENGYQVYKTYQRLRSKGNAIDSLSIDYCNEKDIHDLKQMMNCTFDVRSDHIPTDDELEVFVTNRQIICVRNEECVIGFIIFEDKGKTSYIRMVCIDEKYQGKGLADTLMKMYFKIHEQCTSFTLWYDMQNSRAHALYKKWNYNEEELYNLIYVI